VIDDALNELASGTPTDLRNLQVKFTYVGPQKKPVPTVVFTTLHHVLAMEWFSQLRRPDLHYDNDAIAALNFTVTSEEMVEVVKVMVTSGLHDDNPDASQACLSVMASLKGSRMGDLAFEAVIDSGRCSRLLDSMRKVFRSNQIAFQVIGQQQQLSCP
jgi:hypothetical protein